MRKNNGSVRQTRAFQDFVHFLPVVLDDKSTKRYFSFSGVFSLTVEAVYVKLIPGFYMRSKALATRSKIVIKHLLHQQVRRCSMHV